VWSEDGGEPREYPIPTTRYTSAQEPYDLRWFGDGSGLGFSGTDAQGRPAIFRLSLTTGQWKSAPSPVKTWTRLEWNTDGTKYFYARQAPGSESSTAILEHDLNTNADRAVYQSGVATEVFRGLRLGPDRRSLAFTVSAIIEGQPALRLMVLDTESGQVRTLVDEKGGVTIETGVNLGVPAWSPDGRAVIVPRTAGVAPWPEIRVVPVDGGTVRSFSLDKSFVFTSPGSGEMGPAIRDLTWSRDGTRVAFVLAAFQSNTWVLENALAGVGSSDAARPR
jgi:Tol biopolymer transport system component